MRDAAADARICCGVFREAEHSPGREADDAGILKATGRRLAQAGLAVAYVEPDALAAHPEPPPALVFAMCEGPAALESLRAWERRGACVVNSAMSISRASSAATGSLVRSSTSVTSRPGSVARSRVSADGSHRYAV